MIFLLAFAFFSLSCGALDSFLCMVTGGEMIEDDFLSGRPYNPFNSDYRSGARGIDIEDYNAWRSGETANYPTSQPEEGNTNQSE